MDSGKLSHQLERSFAEPYRQHQGDLEEQVAAPTCRSHESGAVDAQPLTRASAGRNAQLDRPFERRDIDASAERRLVDGHR